MTDKRWRGFWGTLGCLVRSIFHPVEHPARTRARAAAMAMRKAGAWDGKPRDWYEPCPTCGCRQHAGMKWAKEHPDLVDAELSSANMILTNSEAK